MSSTPFFEVQHLVFSHPSQTDSGMHPAVNDLSFSVEQGEYIAIIGANGSGKTTLARLMNGLILPDQGQVWVEGRSTREKRNWRFIRQQVGMIFQHPQEQMIATTIEEDVAFGLENLGLGTSEIRSRVHWALEQVNMWKHRERPPQFLSSGQMQRVAIAGILAMQPKCIIFDEASAMLDPKGRKDLLERMELFHQQGITLLTITHFMEEAAKSDRILAMKDGRLCFDGPPASFFSDQAMVENLSLDIPPALSLAHQLRSWIPEIDFPLTLKEMDQQLKPSPTAIKIPGTIHRQRATPDYSLVRVQDLSFTYYQEMLLSNLAVDRITLELQANQLHGLIGPTGAGKSTFMQHLNGLYLPQTGTVQVGPFRVHKKADLIKLRRYAAYVFQNPNYQLFEQYVGDEIAYGLRLQNMHRREIFERVRATMQWLGINFDQYKDRMIQSLSGGERRKVALASMLVMDPALILLDEPTAGLDPASRKSVLSRLKEMIQQKKTVLISTHHLDDLATISQQINVIYQGKLIIQNEPHAVLADLNLLKTCELLPPFAVQAASLLGKKGYELLEPVITMNELVSSFQTLGLENGV